MTERKIHFHKSDERFCQSVEPCREFSFDEANVTCRECQDRDRLWLSDAARAYVDSLETRTA